MTQPETPISIFSNEEIQRFRNETVGCKFVTHFNNAGAGLMPDVVTNAQLSHLNLEAEVGGYEAAALNDYAIREFYEQTALLLNCRPSNVAFTSSATDSFSRALSSIPFVSGDVILTDRDDFVSNQIQFLSLQKRLGIQIIHIHNAHAGGVDLDDLREKLKKHNPKLLAITHIPTNSGLVQPVDQIAGVYKEHKNAAGDQVWYILDACQSVGQIKLDTQKLQCDFMSFTCRKFLRGPRGTGVLYVSNTALDSRLEPMFIDMRGAEWTEIDSYKQQSDAKRFEDWEFAYSTVIGTMEAIKYCRNIGEEKITQQLRSYSGQLRGQIGNLTGVRILDRGNTQCAIITFYAENSNPDYIKSELLKQKINVVGSYRAFGLLDFDDKGVKWAIRVSPHYYNTAAEAACFTESLQKILSRTISTNR